MDSEEDKPPTGTAKAETSPDTGAMQQDSERWIPRKSGATRWSPQDWRILLITINGTVAANMVTVIIIGVAISLARLHGLTLSIALAGSAVLLVMLIPSFLLIRLMGGFKASIQKNWFTVLMLWVWVLILLTATLLFFLVVIGKAAGIK